MLQQVSLMQQYLYLMLQAWLQMMLALDLLLLLLLLRGSGPVQQPSAVQSSPHTVMTEAHVAGEAAGPWMLLAECPEQLHRRVPPCPPACRITGKATSVTDCCSKASKSGNHAT
jgi:hypothetical protein